MKEWLRKEHNPIFFLSMVDTKTGEQTPVVTENNLRIPFIHGVSEALLAEHRLEWLLMDRTWQTNYHGMLIGAVGPVGLHVDGNTGPPSLRFVPVVFMASETEDNEASELLLQAYFEFADRYHGRTTHAVMDCRCMSAAAPQCTARGIHLHRCLQHVKGNVAEELGLGVVSQKFARVPTLLSVTLVSGQLVVTFCASPLAWICAPRALLFLYAKG